MKFRIIRACNVWIKGDEPTVNAEYGKQQIQKMGWRRRCGAAPGRSENQREELAAPHVFSLQDGLRLPIAKPSTEVSFPRHRMP